MHPQLQLIFQRMDLFTMQWGMSGNGTSLLCIHLMDLRLTISMMTSLYLPLMTTTMLLKEGPGLLLEIWPCLIQDMPLEDTSISLPDLGLLDLILVL